MASRETIIERVRLLFARAGAKGVTDEEAQAFNAKAVELMIRHDLDEAVIRQDNGEEPEPVGRWDYTVRGKGGHGKARVAALAAITSAYGCESAVRGNDASSHDRILMIVGTTAALESLKILLPALSMQMEAGAIRATRGHVDQLDPYWHTPSERARERRTFFRSYLRGWGRAVAAKVDTAREDIAEEATGTSTALVLVTDRKRVTAEFARQFPKLGKARGERTYNHAGYQAGTEAGRRADVGTGKLADARCTALH